jgi:GDP-L-fucose synthase|tara:strand:+ start:513 stop:1448 length:936 start_codon:yes stop_codon:yes gene_type:complete
MEKNSKIYVAGNTGLVGSALIRRLKSQGYNNIISSPSSHWDLRKQDEVQRFFRLNEPDYVFLAAAKVGGINFNKNYPADFIHDNIYITTNIITESHRVGVKKLCNLGSACIYPKMTPQPIKEEYLLTSPLEETNEAYAIAKILGLKMCQFYNKQYGFESVSLMPTNLYGPGDNFNVDQCHVIPGMINKFITAKETGTAVTLWGDGTPTRQFMYSDDLADACIFLMQNYDSPEIINVSTEEEYTIREICNIISTKLDYNGEIFWDTSKPNGTPRRKVCTEKLYNMGWRPKVSLEEGLEKSINWFMENRGKFQ